MRIAIDSDVTGFRLKRELVAALSTAGFEVADLGAPGHLGYPDVGHILACVVAAGAFDRGILVCGTGMGMAIVANKVSGVYAGVCRSVRDAKELAGGKSGNVMAIGCSITDAQTAAEIALAFAQTPHTESNNTKRLTELSR